MPSRQDQLHSYQFTVQRVVSALVMRETDPAQPPFRRVAGATLVGVLLAALALGAVAVYGVLSPGDSGKWRDDKVVIVEKESGALFLYRENLLHPVLNYASALLILNAADTRTVQVAHRSTEGVARGVPWGIAGAPDSLPPKASLYRGAWSVCSHLPDGAAPRSALFVGAAPGGGSPLDGRGLLITAPDGATYLLWRAHKHRIPDASTVLALLVWSGKPRLVAAAAFVNAVPAGPDLMAPPVVGRGTPVARLNGAKVGQVYSVKRATGNGEVDYFIVTPDGVASVTALQAELVLGGASGQTRVAELSPQEFTRLTQGAPVPPYLPDGASGDAALPAAVPELADAPTGGACVAVSATEAQVRVDVPMPDLSAAVATRSTSAQGAVLADRIAVRPGTGALIRAVATPGATTGALCVVTDLGIRYAVPAPEALTALGYAGEALLNMPAEIVALLPAGPALDRTAAQAPVVSD